MNTRIALAGFLLVMGSRDPGAAQDGNSGQWQEGRNSLALDHQGRLRTALVFLPNPAGIPPEGWPLVLMLHGAGGAASNAVEGTGWAEVGKANGFITVFPNGTAAHEGRTQSFIRNPQTWNSGAESSLASGVRSAWAKKVDDVGFLSALLDSVSRRVAIDPRRVFVAGHSNGAGMAYRFGLERADRVAAVGVMAGHLMRGAEALAEPVSLIQVVGDHDPFTPMDGGMAGIGKMKAAVAPALDGPKRWARMLGLSDLPKIISDDKKTRVLQWGPTEKGLEVRSIIVKGHGHAYAWPEGRRFPGRLMGPVVPTANATEALWNFFRTHPKP